MTGNEYQDYAMRTNDGLSAKRLEFFERITTTEYADMLNGALGLAGESGEVCDLIKKGIFHEKGINIGHLTKEIGDVMWYVAMLCHSLHISLDEVMQTNVDKLKARYPEGFDAYRANHKAVEDI